MNKVQKEIIDWLDAESNVAATNADRFSTFMMRVPDGWPKDTRILLKDAYEIGAKEVVTRMWERVEDVFAEYDDHLNFWCQDGHEPIRCADDGSEMCPVCKREAEITALRLVITALKDVIAQLI